MRYCPFCSADNVDEASSCSACGRRLPPLPKRRRRAGELSQPNPAPSAPKPEVSPDSEKNTTSSSARQKSPSPGESKSETTQSSENHRPDSDAPIVQSTGESTDSGWDAPGESLDEEQAEPTQSKSAQSKSAQSKSTQSKSTQSKPSSGTTSDGQESKSSSLSAPPSPDAQDYSEHKATQAQATRQRQASVPPPLPKSSDRAASATPVPRPRANSVPPPPSRKERDRVASLARGISPTLLHEEKSEKTYKSLSEWPAPQTQAAAHPEDWSLAQAKRPESADEQASVEGESKEAENTAGDNSALGEESEASTVHDSSSDKNAIPKPSSVDASQSWSRPQASPEIFKSPDVIPVPTVPEAGWLPALKYTLNFGRARWQRRSAIKTLKDQIRRDTGVLDGVLGALGRQARSLKLDAAFLADENQAIDEAEKRRQTGDHECSELSNRQAEENSKFASAESDKLAKVKEAEDSLESAQNELGGLEAQRRSLRDKRKSIEARQKGYLKAADSRQAEAEKQEVTATRDDMRHAAEALRRDAEALDSERQDVERRSDSLDAPISHLSSRVDALKSDLDAAKRSLTDLREGHRHRIAELEAEQGRRTRELAQAEAEIQRRLVTLGTLVNLNRVDRGEFRDLYEQIDVLRTSIGARSNDIDKLSAEREAFDKASLIRGAGVIAAAVVAVLLLLAIILALF